MIVRESKKINVRKASDSCLKTLSFEKVAQKKKISEKFSVTETDDIFHYSGYQLKKPIHVFKQTDG